MPTVWKDIIKCDIIYYQKILKYFKDLKNRHFWVLWLKWNQAMEMIQNQTYIFLLKYIKVFQWLSKSEFVSFMTKMNPNNGNKTKSDIFPWDIFKSGKSLAVKYLNISKTFIIDTFQSLCKREHNQVKWNYTGHVQIWLYFLFTKQCSS